jgi:Zn-dependent protease with chaperone function
MFCLTLVPLLLVPAAYRWWDGRRLRHKADDAALAERWAAHAGRSTRVTLVSVLIVPMLCLDWAIPGMIGVVLLSRAAAYPARRALLSETWSLPAYLDWSVRLFIALAGFWALLAWTPYLVNLAGRFGQIAMVLLAVALVVWQRWFPQVLLRTLRARPLEPGAIDPAFADGVARVVRASRTRLPSLWRAGPTGGVVANALALPSLSESSVLFSDTLLESLSPAEATAIFAHEIAHLEYYDRARLRRLAAATLALIMGAVVSVPLTAWLAPNRMWVPVAAWPIAVIVAMALRGRHSQEHESASDRRAVELCGEPEALASGLVKLHMLARVPRRWSPDLEERASHPSLARRLRDIRSQSGGAGDSTADPVIVQGTDERTWVIIEGDRVRHLSGVPAGTLCEVPALVAAAATAVSLPYEQVSDLRVVIAKNASCNLHIVSRESGAFRCTLRDADVQRVQAALDKVDLKIAPLTRAGGDRLTQILVLLCALVAILVGGHSFSLVVLVVVALIQMTPAGLAGLGAASAMAAAMLLLTRPVGSSSLVVVGAALAGAVLLWRARYWHRHFSVPTEPRWRPLVLAVGVFCVWMAVVLPSTNLMMLHRLVSEVPATAILPAALAATLWTAAPRRRRSGAIMSALATVPLLIAAPQFADRVVGDPFFVRQAPFVARTIALSPVASTPAPENASSLQLSRNGSRFLVVFDDDDESEYESDSRRFVLGDFRGHQREIAALDAAFIDDQHLLVVSRNGDNVRVVLDSGASVEQPPSWQESFELPGAAHLDVDSMSGRWRITSRSSDRLYRVEGTAGSVGGRQEWRIPDALKQRQWLPGNGDDAFGWSVEFQYQRINWWPLLYSAGISHIPFWPARFDALHGGRARPLGRTFQETICQPGPPGSAVLCFLSDGRTTRIWRFDGHRFDLAGTVAGKMIVNSRRSATETISWIDGRDALVDFARQEVLWLDHPLGGCCPAYGWDAVSGLVGAIVDRGEAQRVVTWRVTGAR